MPLAVGCCLTILLIAIAPLSGMKTPTVKVKTKVKRAPFGGKIEKKNKKILFLVRKESPGAENFTVSVIFHEDFIFDSPRSPR